MGAGSISLTSISGYKVTELGIIPEDWDIFSIGERSVKVGSGITPTGGERVYVKSGVY